MSVANDSTIVHDDNYPHRLRALDLVFTSYSLNLFPSLFSVPLLQKLPNEKLSKLADVLEVVSLLCYSNCYFLFTFF